MPNNAVLVIGGFSEGQPLDSAEVIFEYYDETSQQTFIDRGGVNAMHGPRGGCEGILLPNQTVLVVGGAGLNREMIVAGEFFNPL